MNTIEMMHNSPQNILKQNKYAKGKHVIKVFNAELLPAHTSEVISLSLQYVGI